MERTFETEEEKERIILVAVDTGTTGNRREFHASTSIEKSLDELQELAETAGAMTVGRLVQNREAVHPGTYIGRGKIE